MRGKTCPHRSTSNGYCSQHDKHFGKRPVATNSSNNHAFLNTRSWQAVIVMSEFLASNPPTKEGLSLHHLPRYLAANLDQGFDIDTAGLTSAIHAQLTEVSKTVTRLQNCREIHTYFEQSYAQGKERIRIIKERNGSLRGTAIVSHHLSYYSQYLLVANRSASRAVPTF